MRRLYVGHFMTALDMGGFSLSLLALNDGILKRLDTPTQVRGVVHCFDTHQPADFASAPAGVSWCRGMPCFAVRGATCTSRQLRPSHKRPAAAERALPVHG